MRTGKYVFNSDGMRLYTLRDKFSCNAVNVVYQMTCAGCKQGYIGETQDFRQRMNLHKSDVMHQSIPSANIPPGKPPGKFLRWSKALPRGKIFLQKHGPRSKETPTPGEYFRRSGQLFLLIGVEILGFCRNQT